MALDFANEKPLRSLTLQLAGVEFPGAYESYLQPLLLDTNFKSMQTAGKLAGEREPSRRANRAASTCVSKS